MNILHVLIIFICVNYEHNFVVVDSAAVVDNWRHIWVIDDMKTLPVKVLPTTTTKKFKRKIILIKSKWKRLKMVFPFLK